MNNALLASLILACAATAVQAQSQPDTKAPKELPKQGTPKADQPAGDGKPKTPDDKDAKKDEMKPTIKVTSTAITNDTQMPKKYTVDGENISPPLAWKDAPKETKEFAIIMSDPDANNFVHWVAFKIPMTTKDLPENIPHGKDDAELTKPVTITQGKNKFGRMGYAGPAAGKGAGVHHYHFKVYALDTNLTLKPGATAKELEAAMKGHILAWGELVGNNER